MFVGLGTYGGGELGEEGGKSVMKVRVDETAELEGGGGGGRGTGGREGSVCRSGNIWWCGDLVEVRRGREGKGWGGGGGGGEGGEMLDAGCRDKNQGEHNIRCTGAD